MKEEVVVPRRKGSGRGLGHSSRSLGFDFAEGKGGVGVWGVKEREVGEVGKGERVFMHAKKESEERRRK